MLHREHHVLGRLQPLAPNANGRLVELDRVVEADEVAALVVLRRDVVHALRGVGVRAEVLVRLERVRERHNLVRAQAARDSHAVHELVDDGVVVRRVRERDARVESVEIARHAARHAHRHRLRLCVSPHARALAARVVGLQRELKHPQHEDEENRDGELQDHAPSVAHVHQHVLPKHEARLSAVRAHRLGQRQRLLLDVHAHDDCGGEQHGEHEQRDADGQAGDVGLLHDHVELVSEVIGQHAAEHVDGVRLERTHVRRRDGQRPRADAAHRGVREAVVDARRQPRVGVKVELAVHRRRLAVALTAGATESSEEFGVRLRDAQLVGRRQALGVDRVVHLQHVVAAQRRERVVVGQRAAVVARDVEVAEDDDADRRRGARARRLAHLRLDELPRLPHLRQLRAPQHVGARAAARLHVRVEDEEEVVVVHAQQRAQHALVGERVRRARGRRRELLERQLLHREARRDEEARLAVGPVAEALARDVGERVRELEDQRLACRSVPHLLRSEHVVAGRGGHHRVPDLARALHQLRRRLRRADAPQVPRQHADLAVDGGAGANAARGLLRHRRGALEARGADGAEVAVACAFVDAGAARRARGVGLAAHLGDEERRLVRLALAVLAVAVGGLDRDGGAEHSRAVLRAVEGQLELRVLGGQLALVGHGEGDAAGDVGRVGVGR
mmetsp:Transcript_20686/g.73050  ORF Transcript_20686/g.73050 Transcript_20686/m.73050 type:complete len:676 (+) Transcript_20686:5391-7418(+)